MYASIIPFSHSIGTRPLTYRVPPPLEVDLHVGGIVEIPMRKNTEHGIISAVYQDVVIDNETDFVIKDIESIVTPIQVLAPYQMLLIEEISSKYIIPIHRVLGFFLTKPILHRLEKKWYPLIAWEKSSTDQRSKLYLSRESIITPEHIANLLTWPTIIVVPDDFAMWQYHAYFGDDPDTLYLWNESTDTRRSQAWIDITNRKYLRIFWTRRILYYNLSAYTDLLYLEDAFGREYFHYPIRMQYIDILDMFRRSWHGDVSIVSSNPLLTTLSLFRDLDLEYIW